MIITSVLAMSRWYQISYPLRVLSRTAVEISLTVLCLLQAIYFPLMLFNDSPESTTQMEIHIQTVTIRNGEEGVPGEAIFAFLLTSLSSIASSLTIWNILNSSAFSENLEIRSRKIRSTIKIMFLNIGNVLFIAAILSLISVDRKKPREHQQLL